MLGWRGYRSRLRGLLSPGRAERVKQICTGLHDGEEGASIVEFALVGTLMCAVLFGIFQTCLAVYTYDYVSEIAREGTRYAIVRGASCAGMTDCKITGAQLQTYLQGIQYPGTNPTNHMTVTTTWFTAGSPPSPAYTLCTVGTCNLPGNLVKVDVVYAFPLAIWGHSAINIKSTSQMVISQ
jgi:Flp pilus assembly protein TadG